MEKTIAERLTDIFGPDIDENGCISLDVPSNWSTKLRSTSVRQASTT